MPALPWRGPTEPGESLMAVGLRALRSDGADTRRRETLVGLARCVAAFLPQHRGHAPYGRR